MMGTGNIDNGMDNRTEEAGRGLLQAASQAGGESETSALRRYDVYLSERATLGEQQFRTSQAFDKAILTVSAGAFALTPALIQTLGAGTALSCKWLAVMGWAFLGIAVVATLFAMTASQKACMAQVQVIEDRYLEPDSNVRSNKWQEITGIANWVALGALGVGLATVGAFAGIYFL
jgi:hypothetical protein